MSALIQVVGLMLEVVGVILLSRSYMKNASKKARVWVLFSALKRGAIAKGAARVTLAEERTDANIAALQGLALVVVGFVLQVVSVLLGVYSH